MGKSSKDDKKEQDLSEGEMDNNQQVAQGSENTQKSEGTQESEEVMQVTEGVVQESEDTQKTKGEKSKEAELVADLQRTRADFENYRKQIEMQKENERKNVKLATVLKFLPLLDDIDRAISSYQELAPLGKSMEKTLKELGLAKIPSEAGVEFDPDLHEAVVMEGDGEKIAEVLRPGYYYEGSVLRPTMVKVA